MRGLISILAILALSVLLLPAAPVMASATGSSAGSFSVGSVAPNISALQVFSDPSCLVIASALAPQSTYYLRVSVSDANTLNNIAQVKVKTYYDAGATHPDESTITAGSEQTAAIFTWTKIGNVWAVDGGAGSSWAVVGGSSTVPTLTASSGDWIFAIKFGKVATETTGANVWDFHARAIDTTSPTPLTAGYYLLDKLVLWYGEVHVNTANVNFGSVALGSGFSALVNKVTSVSVTMIANGDYAEKLKSSATWTGSSNTATLDPLGLCVNTGEFALKGWPADIYGSALVLDATGVTMHLDTLTPETGDVYITYTLWLKIASVFPVDVYSGSITFLIVNN
jgi:hypothetical protein